MYTFVLCMLFIELILETGIQLQSNIVQGLSFKNVVIYGLFLILLLQGKMNVKAPLAVKKVRAIFLFTILYALIALFVTAYMYQRTMFLIPNLISLKNTLLDSLICFLIFYFLCARVVQPIKLMRYLAIIIGIAASVGVIDSVVPMIAIFGFDESDATRANGPFGEVNQTAAVLSLYLPFVASLAVADRKRRFMYLGLCVAIAGGIIATASRGGVVAAAVGGLMFMWLSRKELSIGTKFLLISSATITAICTWFIMPVEFREMVVSRFILTFDADVDLRTATAGRSLLLEVGWQLWLQSPIIGQGWGGFYNLVQTATHNVYLSYLVDLGIIGFMLLVMLWYRIMRYLLETRKYCFSHTEKILINGLVAGVFALLVAITFVNLYKPWLFVWSFIGLGMAYATRIRVGNAKKFAAAKRKRRKFYFSPEPVEGRT